MRYSLPPVKIASDDLALLAYAQHMVQTVHSEAARHLFETFAEQARRRLGANGGCRLSEGRKDERSKCDEEDGRR